MQIVGYHHSISPVEKVLPKLLEKVLAAGQRAVVMAPSDDELKIIDTFLWTYSKSELLPNDQDVAFLAGRSMATLCDSGENDADWVFRNSAKRRK